MTSVEIAARGEEQRRWGSGGGGLGARPTAEPDGRTQNAEEEEHVYAERRLDLGRVLRRGIARCAVRNAEV